MKRRDLLILSGAAIAWPPTVRAQRKVMPLIGFLDLSRVPTPDRPSVNLASFKRGLGELGYQEHRDYIIDAQFADTDRTRLPALARELVSRNVDIIVTIGTPPVRAAKAATAAIPIVMAGSESPVEAGLIASFAHPGGNVTGLTHSPGPGIVSKALQLLKEAAPNISRIAVLGASDGSSSSKWISDFSVAKRALNVTFLPHNVIGVGSTADFNAILSKIKEEHADAVFVFAEFENIKYRNEILNLLSENRLPSMFQGTDFVRDGGLLSYYADFQELRRQAAGYVDKILKGAKPADLPVEQPTKFALTINLKTAKELGLTMPQLLLAQADEVVE